MNIYGITWNIWEILIISLIYGHFTNFATNFQEISIISSYKGWNRWAIDEISGFHGIFQIFPGDLPKPRYPSHTNSRDKESLNSSTQAKLEEQLEEQHRQGVAVQPYPVIT